VTGPIRTLNLCQSCRRPQHVLLEAATTTVRCAACGATRALEPGAVEGGALRRCPWCACPELYRQRDFHQTLGCALMLAAAVASIIVNALTDSWWWLAILAGGVAIDAALWWMLPDRAGCYVCHAEFRNVPNLAEIPGYDLHAATRIEYAGPRREPGPGSRVQGPGSAPGTPD